MLSQTAIDITGFIVLINLVLAVFNMIPIPPLDGSKVFFALLPQRYMAVRAHLEQYGMVFILLILFLFLNSIRPIVFFLFNSITGGVGL